MRLYDISEENDVVIYSQEEYFRLLSLEDSITNNAIDFFRKGIPTLISKITGSINIFNFGSKDIDIKELENDLIITQKNHLKSYYLYYRDLLVQIPEGFKGEFLPYVTELNDISTNLVNYTHNLLMEYRFVLSSIITNTDQRTSLKDLTANYERAAASRKELENRLKKYFTDTVRSRDKLGSVLPTYSDAAELVRQTKQLNLFLKRQDLKELHQSVRTIVDLLTVLEDNVKKKDITEISPKVIKNISKGAYEIASYIDQIVIFYYSAASAVSCVKLLMEKLKNLDVRV